MRFPDEGSSIAFENSLRAMPCSIQRQLPCCVQGRHCAWNLRGLEKLVRQMAQEDLVCVRLMTMPGVGVVVALTYRSAVDDPARFTSSKNIGPWVGLTPSRNQSGERDVSGSSTKAGDVNLRRALCQAATVMMNRGRSTWLRAWGAQLAKRRGRKRAMVALARWIAVILHHMWVDGPTFQFEPAPTH